MDQKEFDDVVFKVTEAVLLRLPEVIGNLLREQAMINKLNKKFYGEHPEFKDNLPLIGAILEQLESENVGIEYDKLLEKATPLIKEKIGIMKSCGITTKQDIKSLDLNADDLGPNGVM